MKKLITLFVVCLLVSGCTNDSQEDLLDCSNSDLQISDITSVKSSCDVPGSLSVQVEGGEAPYEFSLDGQTFQTSQDFADLAAGNFTITVRDDLGCVSTRSFTLEAEDSGITLSITSENSDCLTSTGSVAVSATGGEGVIEYSIDEGSFSATSEFGSLAPGVYKISARDENGCVASQNVTIGTLTSLQNDIMPIISANCAISGCHNGSISPNLSTTNSVMSNASRIKSETQSRSMPRGRTLSTDDIDLIACWVDDGANNN